MLHIKIAIYLDWQKGVYLSIRILSRSLTLVLNIIDDTHLNNFFNLISE